MMQQHDPSDLLHMTEALRHAEQAAREGEVPVGAVVVYQGRVIATGYNTREHDQDFTAHAELLAMQRASKILGTWRLTGCTVYVTLEPCAMCAGAMVQGRIDRCVYGASDPKGGFLGTVADLSCHPVLNHRFEVTRDVMGDAGGRLLKDFFQSLRRR
jgi:tRNA(adenine34) deaminase